MAEYTAYKGFAIVRFVDGSKMGAFVTEIWGVSTLFDIDHRNRPTRVYHIRPIRESWYKTFTDRDILSVTPATERHARRVSPAGLNQLPEFFRKHRDMFLDDHMIVRDPQLAKILSHKG